VVLQVDDSREEADADAVSQDLGDHQDADLRAAGQAVLIVGPGGGDIDAVSGPDIRVGDGGPRVTAYALGRRLQARSASDPRLRAFVEYWLGRAAG
jgi:hypothetical protein